MRIIDLAYQALNATDKKQLKKSGNWSRALVVREDFPASDVADIVDLNKMDLVVVVDRNNTVRGGLTPKTVIKRAKQQLALKFLPGGLAGTVVKLRKKLELEKKRDPHKTGFEWLNLQRPDWHWCDPGNHLTSEDPCSKHEK